MCLKSCIQIQKSYVIQMDKISNFKKLIFLESLSKIKIIFEKVMRNDFLQFINGVWVIMSLMCHPCSAIKPDLWTSIGSVPGKS